MTLFLAGDVMLGRGIDQILPRPGDPGLYESHVKSASKYVALAEEANGPIPKPVDFTYVWGDALAELERRQPDARIVNLETAVTKSEDPAPKGINYKMNPENTPVLVAAGVSCCALANNHVLDWGPRGLVDTLDALERHGLRSAGAGRNNHEAAIPAVLPLPGKGRVLVYSFGCHSSGIPCNWAATEAMPGINVLSDLSGEATRRIADDIHRVKTDGDIIVLSIHWGDNWGYSIAHDEIDFAHGLIDVAAVDIVHGHSSHHAKAIEIYRGKPILYGCGDFLNDYEGIRGFERFRNDLALMYLVTIDLGRRTLSGIEIVPFVTRNFRLGRASSKDTAWVCDTLTREGSKFGTRIDLTSDHALTLTWE